MNWPGALFWIDAMNTASYLGFNDWHLPITTQPDSSCSADIHSTGFPLQGFGPGCTGSEMGHLFNVEGVTATTLGLFSNVQPAFYWSITEYAPDTNDYAWAFNFDPDLEDQDLLRKYTDRFAWAVRAGDVSAVPIPASAWLFGSGLLGLIGVARKKYTYGEQS